MTLSDLSIRRPVFAWMLMVGLLVFGALSFTKMGISQLPDVDFPVVNVRVTWVGASPETIEHAADHGAQFAGRACARGRGPQLVFHALPVDALERGVVIRGVDDRPGLVERGEGIRALRGDRGGGGGREQERRDRAHHSHYSHYLMSALTAGGIAKVSGPATSKSNFSSVMICSTPIMRCTS